MDLKATIEFSMDTGEKLLVLIAHSLEDQHDLYAHLLRNARDLKSSMTFRQAQIEYITAGYWDKNNVINWQHPLIPLAGHAITS